LLLVAGVMLDVRLALWGVKWPSVGFAVGNAGHGLY